MIVIPSRFNGPPGSANGGYSCGLFARQIDGAAEVTLRRPPPLDAELHAARDADGVSVHHGDTLIAEVRPGEPLASPPEPVDFDLASKLSRPHHPHPFPTCFVCGHERRDGLRLFTAAVPGRDVAAAAWVPQADLAGDDGLVPAEIAAASLDCPSGWAHDVLGDRLRGSFEAAGGAALLGRMTLRIDEPVRAGERCVVLAWRDGGEGRKRFAGSALYGEDGRVRAVARTTWIVPAAG